ncbi:hypothetical protein GTQ99_15985, partial [Kineococcus sp. T13]|uniref:hypothetical protein n=1 Tax=Kineococcus vitellinus TaxID=2696565 RepID=UPI00141365C6
MPGRLLLRLLDDDPDAPDAPGPGGGTGHGALVAANTGAPLDAEGVQGLATLRASAKREPADGVVGRFGVGFSAVLAVTDEPVVSSTSGAVRFSRARTAELLGSAGSPAARAEADRRGGAVPVLRLPFAAPDAAPPPPGYDTAVVLPLRDRAARELAERLLAEVGDVLLLALPALGEVVVQVPGAPERRCADVEERWHVLRRRGRHEAALLAGRGVEERSRRGWQLAWALPRAGGTPPPGVVCAPTPTDEELPWPAVLVATFPLGPDRRRLAPGPAGEALLEHAAQAYCDLLVEVAADGGDAVALLPHGAAAGRVDAQLRRRVLERAREAPLLPAVEADPDGAVLRVRPSAALALTGAGADDPQLLAALAPALAGLVAAPRALDRLLTDLGVQRLSLADVLDVLPAQEPAAAARLFAALAPLAADPLAREAMAGLPVPLLDGRVVHGARGTVLLPGGVLDAAAAAVLAPHGLRVVHPRLAAGPAQQLLVRLGAREGGAWAVLTDPAVRAAVAASPDAEDPDAVADAVLGLVAAVVAPGADPGRDADGDADVDEELVARVAEHLPWLADLALPDADDELCPAGALVLPGSLAERSTDPEEVGPVSPDLLAAWGPGVLRAVGVLAAPAVVRPGELDLADPAAALELGLADADEYVEQVWGDVLDEAAETVVAEAVAVRDLDLVTGAWPQVLAALAATPGGVAALTLPWSAGAHRRTGLSAWWLRRHGPLPAVSRPPGGAPAWLPAAPPWVLELPAGVRAALGVLDDLGAAGPQDLPPLLAAAARAAADVPALDLLRIWTALGRDAARVVPGEPPAAVAALDAAGRVVAADPADVVVVDSPAWAQRRDLGPRVLVPAAAAADVARLLDADLASERAEGRLRHPAGALREVPAAVAALLPGAPASWTLVERLRCDGEDVGFWVTGEGAGAAVVATGAEGAARGLARRRPPGPARG